MAEYPVPEGGFAVTRKEAIERGHKVYLTGRECPKGHKTLRQVSDWKCVECRRQVRAVYRENNRDKINAWKRDWFDKNPDRYAHHAKYNKGYADQNNDRVREIAKSNYRINKGRWVAYAKIRSQKLEYRASERIRLIAKKAANPGRYLAYARNRRAKLKGSIGKHTHDDILKILSSQNSQCVYCEIDISDGYHVDHMTPISRGGSNSPENLQCLCARCNLEKWTKTDEEYRKQLGRL